MLGYFLTNEGQDTRISGAQPERRLCWKGEYRRNRKERERERYAEERVCDREREKRPRILFWHHWQGSEMTAEK